MRAVIEISKDASGRIRMSLPYDPDYLVKIKTIPGYKWHPEEKQWSFPCSDEIIEKILKVFKGEDIRIDPALQSDFSILSPSLEKGGKGGFEDLRRELVSRKYSYKTVKGCIYYNRDFLNFVKKAAYDVTDSDIKDYLLYLAEKNSRRHQH